MSWFKTTLFNLRAAFKAARPTSSPHNKESTIQTAVRESHIVKDAPKLMQRPKLTHPTRPPMSVEEQQRMAAWQKLLDEPSNHQRLAPYT